jgi:hypothetical protein
MISIKHKQLSGNEKELVYFFLSFPFPIMLIRKEQDGFKKQDKEIVLVTLAC